MMPAEYAALGMPQGPAPFTLENLVSIATLVGGIFGDGGGDQLSNAVLYENMTRRFGNERYVVDGSPRVISAKRKRHLKHAAFTARRRRAQKRADHSGFATFLSFDDPNDPEAPTTVHGKTFKYQTLPKPTKAVAKTIALPDYGSVQYVNHVVAGAPPSGSGPPLSLSRRAESKRHAYPIGDALGPSANAGPGLLAFPRGMSNALLISARDSASGHPLAVMGPQVSYFSPEILMEEDIHGPGIDAAGAAFPGVNLYVELGHGPDYAWSATSSGQNIIDTFAVPLCNPSGGAVSKSSDYYVLHGQCVAMQALTDHESWTPNLADSTPAGSITLQTQRTAYGIVIARARRSSAAARHPRRLNHRSGLHQPPLDLHARARVGGRLRAVQRAGRDAHAAGLHERRLQDRLHVQLVVRQQRAHRVLQLGAQPGPRAAHRSAVSELVDIRLEGITPGAHR